VTVGVDSIGPAVAVRADARPWLVLVSTGLAVFAVLLDTTILFVAFTAIGADFPTVGISSLSWVLNAYTIALAATLIPGGRLADRIGRRRAFLGAVVVFTVASILCGLAGSIELLIAARVLQGIGAAVLVPASLALVLQTFPRAKVPMAIAIWSAIGAVAGAVGPTLGAFVVEHAGWRWAFYVNLPVGLVSLALGRRVLSEGREANPGAIPDPFGVLLLVAALAAMAWAIVQTESWGWVSGSFVGTFTVALLLIALFIRRCARVANPLIDLKLFESLSCRLANAGTFVFAVGFSAMFLGNVLFLTEVWGYSIMRAGLAVSLGPLVVATTAPIFGRLAGRIGQRRLLIPGGLVWASSGVLLLATASTHVDFARVYLPAILLSGLGVSLTLPQLASASVQGLHADGYGAGSAVNQCIRNLGGTLGVALVIAFVGTLGAAGALDSFHSVWWLLVASGVTVSTLALFLPRMKPPTVRKPA
jgi:EmrB/QacA subfamily drug resistance transporter